MDAKRSRRRLERPEMKNQRGVLAMDSSIKNRNGTWAKKISGKRLPRLRNQLKGGGSSRDARQKLSTSLGWPALLP